jgi:hypothetical protein
MAVHPDIIKRLEAALTKDDWLYMYMATHDRFVKSAAKLGEPKNSLEFEAQRMRIMSFLMAKAFGNK